MPLRRERISVADLLLRVTPPLDARTRSGGMTLRVDAGDAGAAVVAADPEVVQQILFNLVDNACKYAAAAPDPEFHAAAVRVLGQMYCQVRDSGWIESELGR